MGNRVLLVDDDPIALRLVAFHLNAAGIETVGAGTGAEALRLMEEETPAAVVLDLMLPDVSGRELLDRFRPAWPNVPVVVLTAHGAVDEAVECMRRGACDFVQKPFDETRLVASVRNAMTQGLLRVRVETLSRELRGGEGFATILGRSPALRRSVELLRRAAQSDVTLLLEGESGTGKEVAARAVHAESARRDGPFVAVNCGAIPEALVESELFGHEKGAFTGAQQARKGVFEQADGGTIFLDEIGELRIDLQVRLLRVLQDRAVTRVGGAAPRRVDVRVLAATNRDLRAEVARGAFREDVYYRLAVFPVRLPPLRDRESDVLILAQTFLDRFAARHGRVFRGFTPEASAALQAYAWPGNVRQLENTVERAVILEDGESVSLQSLPDELVCAAVERRAASAPASAPTAAPAAPVAPVTGPVTLPPPAPERRLMPWEDGFVEPAAAAAAAPAPVLAPAPAHVSASVPARAPEPRGDVVPLEELERRAIVHALEATRGNVQEAAERLGISRATIYRKAERFGLSLR